MDLIRGGYYVRDAADDRYCIDVLMMTYNWRVALVEKPAPDDPTHSRCTPIASFCYFGHGVDPVTGQRRDMASAFLRAAAAAEAWDGVGEPVGYDKQAGQ